MNEPDLQNVVIAGASRGLGLAFVNSMLARPEVGRVFAACRDPAAIPELQRLVAEHPDRLSLLSVDVQDEASIAASVLAVRQQVSRLHRVVNTIGVLHDAHGLNPERRLESVSLANLQRSFAVNAFGPILLAKHFMPLLCHPERAVFASLSARVGSIEDNRLGGWYAYRASKAAQNQLIRTLAVEMRRRAPNLICVLLHPGTVDTDLSKPFQSAVADGKLFDATFSCQKLVAILDGLVHEQTGHFFAWDGTRIPW